MIERCGEIAAQGKRQHSTIYVFPVGGVVGGHVLSILRNLYGYEKICGVDNRLCKVNEGILSLQDAVRRFCDNDIFVLASNTPELYGVTREQDIWAKIGNHICNLYGMDISAANDMRTYHLELVAEEIYRNNIEGSIAEAGVYRGDFARILNLFFPNRTLYLYDSFEGFLLDDVDIKADNSEQYKHWIHTHKDTSVDYVMGKMSHPENVVLVKGYIPETLSSTDDTFAFVNIDMDLYHPTYEALKWFWKRLSKGGYIFVHDFGIWDGIDDAVKRFCREEEVGYIPLSDRASVAIVK